MRTEKINFGDYTALDDTRYIYNSGADIVRAAERDNKSFEWKNEQGFVTTSDVGDEYENDPKGLRTYDAGHLVLPAPDPTNTKVVLHVQSNNAGAVDTSGNRSVISFGSGNMSSTNGTLNHPASSVSNILSFRPPKLNDGVFRNLVGVDLESDVIGGTDKDFVIGGFYSEKHRRDMLAHMNSLSQGPSGKSIFLNDRVIEPAYLFKIDESQIAMLFELDSTSLEDLFAGSIRLTVSDAQLMLVADTETTDADTFQEMIGTNIQLDESRVMITLDPVTQQTNVFQEMIGTNIQLDESRVMITLDPVAQLASDYNVWSGTNGLSAGDSYSVGDIAYDQDVVPEIETFLNSL